MPRGNLFVLIGVAIGSLLCYRAMEHDPYVRMFQHTYREIADHYVEVPNGKELIEAGIDGMVKNLDENSAFESPKESRALHSDLHQEFVGIGIEVEIDAKTETPTVISPVGGSPAFEAGILPQDRLIEIDDKPTKGLRLDKLVERIRGSEGASVKLKIERSGEREPLTLNVVRRKIRTDSVLGDTRSSDRKWTFVLKEHPEIVYVRVEKFGERTVEEVQAALQQSQKHGPIKAMVLDLRGNGGGLLDAGVAMCNLFVKDGLIVRLKGRDNAPPRIYVADGGAEYTDFPIAVLVNQRSASASEIVAACLQDHGRAVIGGSRSYGKGTVQNVIPLEEGHSLKLTTAHYFRPSGKNIHRLKDAKETDEWGVLPEKDLEVKLTDEEFIKLLKARRDRDLGRDPVKSSDNDADPSSASSSAPFSDEALQKAVDYLKKAMKSAAS